MKRQRSFTQRRPFSTSDDNDSMFRKNQIDYYNRLIYQCRKDLHKHIKITKKFEIQKQIRKVKDFSTQKEAAEAIVKQEMKLRQIKEFCTEPIIDECLRRLGIKQLDPKLQFSSSSEANEKTYESNESLDLDNSIHSSSKNPTSTFEPCNKNNDAIGSAANVVSINEKLEYEWIVHRIMKHKTMISALDHWNEEVTEYRRWCLRQQERIDGENSEVYERSHKKGKTNPKNGASVASLNGSSLFVALGSDGNSGTSPGRDTDSDPYGYYGPSGGEDGTMKKNRQGQRGRRAKAAALEAKKRGRILRPEESLNWRKPKVQPEQKRDLNRTDQHGAGPQKLSVGKDQSMSSTKTTTTVNPAEKLHPSWQARKEQKEGIVAFQGKKIMFDDE